jgi:hypothetical protein
MQGTFLAEVENEVLHRLMSTPAPRGQRHIQQTVGELYA